MKREIGDFIQDMAGSIADIEDFVKGFDFDTFCQDRKTVYAVIRAFEIMGEAAKNIPDTIRNENPDIPWKQIAGMRDKLIHGYFGVDTMTVWKSAKKDIPQLKLSFSKVMEKEQKKEMT